MPKSQHNSRRRQFYILFGLGILIFALVLPLLALIPPRGQSPALSAEAHQELVSQVVLSTDRTELIGSSPTRGNPNAELVLLKFSDFQCPFCGAAATNMKAFMDDHDGDILYVYKHFPLESIHPEAIPAARASWAAQQQGQFWPYHDALFEQQSQLGADLYQQIAQDLGLDMEQFNRDFNSSASREAVDQDRQLTQQLRLNGTPTFVLNDLLVPGNTPMEFFETVVEQVNQSSSS
jgi:protein-disulfide isomerase